MAFKELNPVFPENIVVNEDFSKLIQEDCEFTWTVTEREFLQYTKELENGKKWYIQSSHFPRDLNADFIWTIHLYPIGQSSGTVNYTSVYLHLIKKKVRVSVTTSVCISLKAKDYVRRTDFKFDFKHNDCGYGCPKFIRTSVLESYLVDNSVTITANVSVSFNANTCYTSNFVSERILQHDYCNLLNGGKYSDFVIYTKDGNEFKVHRCVLATRSKVFAAMLSSKMVENLNGSILIDDCLGSTMKKLLDFIYSCKVHFSDMQTTVDLLDMSEKYLLVDLKLQCSEYLSSIITKNNACSILLLAETYSLTDLKTKVFRYMRKNRKIFSSPDMYELILEKKPRLLMEIPAVFIDEKLY